MSITAGCVALCGTTDWGGRWIISASGLALRLVVLPHVIASSADTISALAIRRAHVLARDQCAATAFGAGKKEIEIYRLPIGLTHNAVDFERKDD